MSDKLEDNTEKAEDGQKEGGDGQGINAQRGVFHPGVNPLAFNMGLHLSDLGNTERMFTQYAANVMYCHTRKMWLHWSRKVWDWNSGAWIEFLAKESVKSIYREAADSLDDDIRTDLAKHALKSESERAISAMVELLKSEPGIPVELSELDSDTWLLNCQNGTVNLLTGELRPHNKDDCITRILSVNYDSEANCPRWMEFLDQVTGDDKDLQDYLQRAVGYSLTADTRTQVLFFLYGLGNNGKSTFLTTIRKLLGQYAVRAGTDTFLIKDKGQGGGPKEGLANLNNKRFVTASELEDGRALAVSLIKDLTGGESIMADRKYEHAFEFSPTWKIWLSGNHKPVIKDTTLSIWRRVKLIPFTKTISPENVDEGLTIYLEREWPGILAWAVRGCLEWQKNGLQEPLAVTGATAIYRKDSDILAEFLEDCCVIEDRASITKTDLRKAYEDWAEENHYDKITQRTFKARLIEKGITDYKGTAGKRFWSGIRLENAE